MAEAHGSFFHMEGSVMCVLVDHGTAENQGDEEDSGESPAGLTTSSNLLYRIHSELTILYYFRQTLLEIIFHDVRARC